MKATPEELAAVHRLLSEQESDDDARGYEMEWPSGVDVALVILWAVVIAVTLIGVGWWVFGTERVVTIAG
jgi:hypothetical protein